MRKYETLCWAQIFARTGRDKFAVSHREHDEKGERCQRRQRTEFDEKRNSASLTTIAFHVATLTVQNARMARTWGGGKEERKAR